MICFIHIDFSGSHTQDVVFTLPGALGGVLFVFAALFSFAMKNGRWAPEISHKLWKMDNNGPETWDNLW